MKLEDSKILLSTRDRIEQSFSLAPSELQDTSAWEELQQHVARIVAYLMEHNMGEFLNMLYIMDVSEEKIKAAFYNSEPDEVLQNVAQIIIEREKRKVITRAEYRESGFTDECERW